MDYCKPILGDKQGNVRLRILHVIRASNNATSSATVDVVSTLRRTDGRTDGRGGPAWFYLLCPGAACYYTSLASHGVIAVPGQLPPALPRRTGVCPSAIRPVCRSGRLFAVSRGRGRGTGRLPP